MPDPLAPVPLLFGDFAAEHKTTRRFLERYPAGKDDWRPHEKSRALGALATHVADIVNRGVAVLTTEFLAIGGRPPMAPLGTAVELIAHFEAGLAKLDAALAAATLAHLEDPWQMRHGERVAAEAPRRLMLRRIMMSHTIHHRAQLGVYYRLLGIPVPGSYGPSADE